MTSQQLILLASAVYVVLLGAAIYFTRPTARRALAALAGGGVVAVAGFGVEVVCQALGLGRYPSDDTGYGPLAMCPAIVLIFAFLSLIGWRIIRRFGWRGELVFLAVIAVLGTIRDYKVAEQATGFIAFTPGITTVLVDLVAWSGLTALAQGVMRLVAGPAGEDRLARRPWEVAGPNAPAARHGRRPARTPGERRGPGRRRR
jgi:hypothetical protein